jgi:hypothetical protein
MLRAAGKGHGSHVSRLSVGLLLRYRALVYERAEEGWTTLSCMTIFYQKKKNNSLDFFTVRPNSISKYTLPISTSECVKSIPMNLTQNLYGGDIEMRAHSQTIDQRPPVRVSVQVGGLDWLHRLYRWFTALSHGPREIPPVSPYGTWDPQRERFQPMRAEAALDIVASQRDTLWSTKLYNSTL